MSHITSEQKQQLMRELAQGYAEMKDINAELAEEGLISDNESLKKCEDSLTECE